MSAPPMVAIGSLFSGIGGLELGVEAALHEAGWAPRVSWQVELDDFCRAVLAKHWPGADRTVTDVCADAALLLPRVDLLVGGPPCQDISGAGKQEGLHGERSGLLFRYLQIVGALRPRMAIAENVRSGSWKSWLGVASCGLRSLGYRVGALEIHAADVGAPHRRARIFVVAYADGGGRESQRGRWLLDGEREALGGHVDRCGGEAVAYAPGERRHEEQRGERKAGGRPLAHHGGQALGDPERQGLALGQGERCDARPEQPPAERASGGEAVADAIGHSLWEQRQRLSGGQPGELRARGDAEPGHDRQEGGRIALGGVGRGIDGIPAGLDRRIPGRWPALWGEAQHAWEPPRVQKAAPWRKQRVKALGNAVVPAVAREAMRWALAGGTR